MATKRNSKSASPDSLANTTAAGTRMRKSSPAGNRSSGQSLSTSTERAILPGEKISFAVPVKAEEEATAISERERIALLAYSLWEKRGRQGGSAEEDWFRAEREVRKAAAVI